MSSERDSRLCTLEAAVGKHEACPEDACPFWEPGGAALGAHCAFERIGLPAGPALATWLLEIRRKLEAASSAEDERALRAAFHQLLSTTSE